MFQRLRGIYKYMYEITKHLPWRLFRVFFLKFNIKEKKWRAFVAQKVSNTFQYFSQSSIQPEINKYTGSKKWQILAYFYSTYMLTCLMFSVAYSFLRYSSKTILFIFSSSARSNYSRWEGTKNRGNNWTRRWRNDCKPYLRSRRW